MLNRTEIGMDALARRGDADPPAGVPARPADTAVWKRASDVVFALLLLVLSAPLLALVALLIKLTSRGPVIYRQTRLGLHGRPYTMYKLRTMRHDCERLTGPQWSRPGDRRVTAVGRFLRKTHLDELPQLWNVLKGDMSIVGPRPERPEFVAWLEESVPHFRERLRVRPGIAGLAQSHLPPDTDVASVRRKLAYDLYYARHASIWLDLRILLCTGALVFGVPAAVACWLFGLPGGERVEQAYEALVAANAAQVQPAA
jgi:lipopolysaccharide/colanic/teichoic acid biosynthesis glycosyltransferase